MGYMGFGMRRQTYMREPRQPHGKIRQLMEIEFNRKGGGIHDDSFTPAQIEEVKAAIRKKIRREEQLHWLFTFGALAVIVGIVLFVIFE